jgi:hypothetical protein
MIFTIFFCSISNTQRQGKFVDQQLRCTESKETTTPQRTRLLIMTLVSTYLLPLPQPLSTVQLCHKYYINHVDVFIFSL